VISSKITLLIEIDLREEGEPQQQQINRIVNLRKLNRNTLPCVRIC